MHKRLIAATTGFALAVGVGLGITQFAQADTASPTPSPSATAAATPHDGMLDQGMGRHGRHQGREKELRALAVKLGVDKGTLADAWKAARVATQPEHPGDRFTTQAEWDSARDARQAAMVKALASELGIDESKVATALTELQTEAQAARTATSKATLERAVSEGKLTQTEADAVQKAIDARIVSPRGGWHGNR